MNHLSVWFGLLLTVKVGLLCIIKKKKNTPFSWIRKLTAWFWHIVMHRVCDFSDLSDTFTASSLQYNSYQILFLLFLFPTHQSASQHLGKKKKNEREAESRAVAGWMRLHQSCLMFYLQQNVGSRLALNSLGKHMLSLGNSSKDISLYDNLILLVISGKKFMNISASPGSVCHWPRADRLPQKWTPNFLCMTCFQTALEKQ